jgi:hypothetical protein
MLPRDAWFGKPHEQAPNWPPAMMLRVAESRQFGAVR